MDRPPQFQIGAAFPLTGAAFPLIEAANHLAETCLPEVVSDEPAISHPFPHARVRVNHALKVRSGASHLVRVPPKVRRLPVVPPTTNRVGPEQISCCQRARALLRFFRRRRSVRWCAVPSRTICSRRSFTSLTRHGVLLSRTRSRRPSIRNTRSRGTVSSAFLHHLSVMLPGAITFAVNGCPLL